YSQGALVLARTDRLDPARLNRAFEATHTASPAGSIMASIDAARALLARDGQRLCARLLDGVAAARARLREVPGVDVLEGASADPAEPVVLLAGSGAHGRATRRRARAPTAAWPVLPQTPPPSREVFFARNDPDSATAAVVRIGADL